MKTKNRDIQIPVRVTAVERATLRKKAKSAGMSVSTFLRAIGLAAPEKR
jgi:hypothetical protein